MNIHESIAERLEYAESVLAVSCVQENVTNYADFFKSEMFKKYIELKDIDRDSLRHFARRVIEPYMQEIDRTTPSAVAFYGGMCIGVVLAHLALDNTELAVFKESIEKSITGLLMDQHINGADIEDQIERSGRGVEVFANGTRPWIESAEGVTISPRRRLGYNFICAHVIAVLSENLSIQERHIITGQLTVGERASMEMEAEVLSRDAGPLYVYDIVPDAH